MKVAVSTIMTSSDHPPPKISTKEQQPSNNNNNNMGGNKQQQQRSNHSSVASMDLSGRSIQVLSASGDSDTDSFHGEDNADNNNNNANNVVSPKKNAAEILEGSIQSLSLATGGNPDFSPSTPPPSVNDSKRKLGKDFMKVLESQGTNISQLSLLVNDSAAGTPFDDVYDIHEVLGEGGFAFVYRCTHKKNGNDYAVKEILTTDYEAAGENLRGEVNALKLLREGPYVVRLLDVYYEDDRTMMVQEIMRGGDLLDKLTEIEVYEPQDARKVSRTMVEAIDYCHKKRICHRDIKPENVLLVYDDDLTHIKLADFGCAKRITGPKCLKTLCGSPQYVAPELLTHEDGYDELCDMWSCGVVIYVLLGGYAPFDAPESELAELITAGDYEFHEEYWADIPKYAIDLIRNLLQVDPRDRFSPAEALNSRWLRRKDKDLANNSNHESNSSFGAWLERRGSQRSMFKDDKEKDGA